MAKRMFVAIDLPEDLTVVLAGLDPHLKGLRWLPAQQLHLTLCFLGAVGEEEERRLCAGLETIHLPRFELRVRGLGKFGRHGMPSVVWAGVVEPPQELFELEKMVRKAAVLAGLEVEKRGYHPHITLGRCKGISNDALQPLLGAHARQNFGVCAVTGFTLFASTLHPGGASHLAVLRRERGSL